MMKRNIGIFVLIFITLFPFAVRADEVGSVTEDFSGTGRREDRNTYAFFDTKNKEVTLPLQYAAHVTTGHIAANGKKVNGIGFLSSHNLIVVGGEAKTGQGAMLYTIDASGTTIDLQAQAKVAELDRIDRVVCGAMTCTLSGVKGLSTRRAAAFDGSVLTAAGVDSGEPGTLFADVALHFNRIASRIRADATVVQDGAITYAFGPGLYASLGSGIELTGGRIPELTGVTIKAIAQAGSGKLLIGGTKGLAPFLMELNIQGFVPSAAAESKKMADAGSGKFFKSATVSPQLEVLEGTSITFMLSANGGEHWEEATAGVAHEFIRQGNDLRYRATLAASMPGNTPHLMKVKIDFVKAQLETPANIRTRDNKRVSDLKNVATKLEKFKKDRRSYPIVEDRQRAVRLNLLGQLLKDGKYLDTMPQDPQHDQYTDRMYDYIGSKSGASYVLRASLEDPAHKSLEKDLDGKPVEPNLYEYSCDDPWYCEGKGTLAPVTAPAAPPASGTAELLQDEQGRVYRIATIGGGATPVEKRKIYIPSPALLNRLRTFYGRMQKVGQATLAEVPRARLIKTADKVDIYYVTETNFKRRLPSWEVFKSYGNDRREVVIVQPEELAAYQESRLIRLVGDSRIWYIEGGAKRLIKSPSVMKARGLKWEHVSPVNFAEYNSYPEGALLQ